MSNKQSLGTELPLVGLGMPVYNGERYVAEAIESILRQSYPRFELVICDNASTDGTEAICRSFAERDARVRYVRNASNIGAHPNYNRSFELAQGKYFKWVPHDDVLAPEYLAECVAAMEANPNASICQTQLDFINEAGEKLGVCGTDLAEAQSLHASVRFAAATLKAHNCYEVMGLFRRELLAHSILLMSFHGADRALIAQMALRGRFLHVSLPLLGVRDHKDRYTRSKVKPKDRATWHDSRLKGKLTFPTWKLYFEYWRMTMTERISASDRVSAVATLIKWWFVNWNLARAVVDVLSNGMPGLVRWAEQVKQTLFSPAPGIDQLRKKGSG